MIFSTNSNLDPFRLVCLLSWKTPLTSEAGARSTLDVKGTRWIQPSLRVIRVLADENRLLPIQTLLTECFDAQLAAHQQSSGLRRCFLTLATVVVRAQEPLGSVCVVRRTTHLEAFLVKRSRTDSTLSRCGAFAHKTRLVYWYLELL